SLKGAAPRFVAVSSGSEVVAKTASRRGVVCVWRNATHASINEAHRQARWRRPGTAKMAGRLLRRHVAEGVELVADFCDQAVVLRIVAELHPAKPVVGRGNGVRRLDLLPGVFLGIVGVDAGGVVAFPEDGGRDEELALRVERQVPFVKRDRAVGELLDG